MLSNRWPSAFRFLIGAKCPYTPIAAIFLTIVVATAVMAAAPSDPLNTAAQEYRQWPSVHMKALIEIRNFDEPIGNAPGNIGKTPTSTLKGTYEFFADGNKFRTSQDLGPAGASLNLESAYDGERFQILYKDMRRLYYTKKNQHGGLCLFNPLLYPVEFLGKVGDGPPELNLSDVQTPAYVDKIIASATLDDSDKNEKDVLVVQLPGGRFVDRDFTWRIRFGISSNLPQKIERVDKAKTVLTSTEINGYQTVKDNGVSIHYPKDVLHQCFGEHGAVISEYHMTIQEFSLHPKFDPDAFTIDYKLADSVVDADHPGAGMVMQKDKPSPPPPSENYDQDDSGGAAATKPTGASTNP